MDKTPLYQQIAESVRQEILYGTLQPGDQLPPVRRMAERWDCTPGTVQRAYKELARQGLIVSRTGQGTHVINTIPLEKETPLRRANLIHQAEAFLLEVLTAGYEPAEVEQAVRIALDRWRVLSREPASAPERTLRFAGSHDPAISLITAHFSEIAPNHALQVYFSGSLGGLIALAEDEADIAGSHLWDEQTDSYNAPFVQRLLPGRRVALLTLAHRHLGLIVQYDNPASIHTLEDLAQEDVRFVNRQPGAGTRVWLDALLRRKGISVQDIAGYEEEMPTHSEVARAVAEEEADVGLGVEAAALAYGLGFLPLTMERYDLVVPSEVWQSAPVESLARWLGTGQAREMLEKLGGYDTEQTGQVEWVG